MFLLKLAHKEKCDVGAMTKEHPKLEVLFQTLVRKGLISESSKPTIEGKALLAFLSSPMDAKLEKRKLIEDSEFDRWWKEYPGTDTFTYKDVTFSGCRTLRAGKDDCKIKLNKILEEGEYTIDELIAALKLDVLQKKENSVKNKTNKLTFMQNSLTYLNQRSFEPFIELIKNGHNVEQQHTAGGVDI